PVAVDALPRLDAERLLRAGRGLAAAAEDRRGRGEKGVGEPHRLGGIEVDIDRPAVEYAGILRRAVEVPREIVHGEGELLPPLQNRAFFPEGNRHGAPPANDDVDPGGLVNVGP